MSQCAQRERRAGKGEGAGAAGVAGLRTQMVFLGSFVQKLHLNGFHYTTLNEPQPEPELPMGQTRPTMPDPTLSLTPCLPLTHSLVYARSSQLKVKVPNRWGARTSYVNSFNLRWL